VDGDKFIIPENTFVDKKSEIIFPNNITDLRVFDNEEKRSKVFLLLPNGEKFSVFEREKEKIEENRSEKQVEKVEDRKNKTIFKDFKEEMGRGMVKKEYSQQEKEIIEEEDSLGEKQKALMADALNGDFLEREIILKKDSDF
jgi:hypothetical protein